MNSPIHTSFKFPSSTSSPHFLPSKIQIQKHLTISSSLFPRSNPNRKKPSSPDHLEFVLDVQDLTTRASSSIQRTFNRFVDSGMDAYNDLTTLVRVDRYDSGRLIVSCKKSSLRFFGWVLLVSVVVGVLVKYGSGGLGVIGGFVRRRDRSLGGREVVVGRRRGKGDFGMGVNPLSPVGGRVGRQREKVLRTRRKEEVLPEWWRDVNSIVCSSTRSKPEYQVLANNVIRAIMDRKMSGMDMTEDDIIQFRQICRSSGVRVSIDSPNVRESFYRTSVELVLNNCCNSTDYSTLGENASEFIVGLADNIGLEAVRAANIVTAAVAARTRSGFLQAWALEMQGKRKQTVVELSRVCFLHQMFPPQESSPEMEMVARGLEKNLRKEQRELLFDLMVGLCGDNKRSAAEALGLTNNPMGIMEVL